MVRGPAHSGLQKKVLCPGVPDLGSQDPWLQTQESIVVSWELHQCLDSISGWFVLTRGQRWAKCPSAEGSAPPPGLLGVSLKHM